MSELRKIKLEGAAFDEALRIDKARNEAIDLYNATEERIKALGKEMWAMLAEHHPETAEDGTHWTVDAQYGDEGVIMVKEKESGIPALLGKLLDAMPEELREKIEEDMKA